MKKVLVAGATGYLGKYVVREFKKQGFWVRALARETQKLAELEDYIDEKFIGEVTEKSSIKAICKDVDIVFSSIGITKQRDKLTYMDVDYQGNKNLLDEAKISGVSKFIFISVFNAEKMKNLKAIQAKQKFEEELKNSGLEYTVIYPNGFFSDMHEYLKMAKSGRGYVFGSGENKINPIHGKDLAEVCVDASSSNMEKINAGGPDILTHNEILTLAFDAIDKEVKITRIPLWVKSLLLGFLRTFTSVKIYGGLEFFMTVLSEDLIAPSYGSHRLKDFFEESTNE